ncbi:phage tail protein [Camelimonas lactis]|uniref:Tail protein P2 I n=1 Tax=Camelimonas lactis TaxID=659006 RepID=A0A4R2GR19_9HYPH|nr:phage tail protein [Camelimonas lactis]TCO12444.1 tail protein P2 I [Camelimonas lactis]
MHSLLPPEISTPIDLALEQALRPDKQPLEDAITRLRGVKLINQPPSLLPWLVLDYGLSELTPYVPNLYDLIEQGPRWQRLRGTPAAVAMGLGWVGYAAAIEHFPWYRAHWNWNHLALTRVRDSEADLPAIEGITQLSLPLRSVMWRGFSGYDVRAMEYSRHRWSQSRYSSHSGVRIGGQAKWSFGRRYESDHTLTDAELQALGVWLAPVDDEPLTWSDVPWGDVPWTSSAIVARSVAMLDALRPQMDAAPGWAVFRDAAGDIIGYRRLRARHAVAPAMTGPYRIGGTPYALQASQATQIYVEAMTDFGDGDGQTAATVAFVLAATPLAPHKPGAPWLPAGAIAAAPEVGSQPVNIPFGRTVRERVCAILRF